VGRSTDEILRVLDALATGGLCPAEWTADKPVIDLNATLGPESMVGPYRVEAVIGNGSFGTVFRAWDTMLERRVALKIMAGEKSAAAGALLAEARAAAGLNHPNICIVHAVDAAEPAPMIVMEYVEGRPLSELLANGPLAPDRAAPLARQLASAMAAAHAHGVVHGDLKPGNIMITDAGHAKIMDFGLARRRSDAGKDDDHLQRGLSGSPAYMSPEQVRGQAASPASDVFAVGLILYEMSTGRRAINATHLLEALHLIEKINAQQLAADVAEPFAGILRRALLTEPAQRARMEDIEQALG
jgi:serine/threonine protein kinase